MRIDAYNAINQIYNTKKSKNVANKGNVGPTDQVEISSFGQSYQIAKKALSEAPDVREDLVADIKTRVQNNTYDVNEEEFADKLIEKYFGINN